MTSDAQQVGTGMPREGNRSPEDEISLWELLAVILRRRTTIVLTILLVTAAALAYTLLVHDRYTTEASFRPQGSEPSSSQLLALAGQFGVNLPGASSEELSPAFYAELLRSREILHRVATLSFAVDEEPSAALTDLLEIDEDTEELRVEEAIEILREDLVSIRTGVETGVVTIEVTTEWSELSKAIADRLLAEIQVFNLDTRRSQAAAERAFIEAQVDSARAELLTTEDSLEAFLEANRRFENSPELTFRHDRLQREISLRQQRYTGLVQALDEARIAEVRDTPVITVLQPPFLPPGPDERPLLIALALGLILGAMGGVVLAFVVEAVRRPAPGDPAREDFQRAWDGLVGSIPFLRRRSA